MDTTDPICQSPRHARVARLLADELRALGVTGFTGLTGLDASVARRRRGIA